MTGTSRLEPGAPEAPGKGVVSEAALDGRPVSEAQRPARMPPSSDEPGAVESRRCGEGEVVQITSIDGKHVVADVRMIRGGVYRHSMVKIRRQDRELSMALVASMTADERERDWLDADLYMFTERWGDDVIARLHLDFCEGLEPGDRLVFLDAWYTPSSYGGVPIR